MLTSVATMYGQCVLGGLMFCTKAIVRTGRRNMVNISNMDREIDGNLGTKNILLFSEVL